MSDNAIHWWLKKHYPKGGICERCGQTALTHYAFRNHPEPYTRNRSDYEELCALCHNQDHAARLAKRDSTCPTCSRDFTARRPMTRYCSNACRQKAYRRRNRIRHVTQPEGEENDGS